MLLYCKKCSVAFDSSKLFVHLRQHPKTTNTEELNLRNIYVLMDKNNIQCLIRAKMEQTMDDFVGELGQLGVSQEFLPHMDTQIDVCGIAFLFIFGKFVI